MKTVACIIARTVSTRLPVKVLRDLQPGVSMLDFIVKRLQAVSSIDEIYICTSENPVDDIMEDVAIRHKVKLYRGSEDKVIERMIHVGDAEKADVVLRVTGDNPFTTTEYLDEEIQFLIENQLDYKRIVEVPSCATPEVIRFDALNDCYSKMDPSVSEYLMLFLFEPKNYACGVLKVFPEDYSNYTVTVDLPADLERTKGVLEIFGSSEILLKDIIAIYQDTSYNLPLKEFAMAGDVKLPYGKTVSIEEFSADMTRRKNESLIKKLYE
jgi:spore coat polysaccharide biosynthesis protein SpsF